MLKYNRKISPRLFVTRHSRIIKTQLMFNRKSHLQCWKI